MMTFSAVLSENLRPQLLDSSPMRFYVAGPQLRYYFVAPSIIPEAG
jgi:hypothetical protein